MESTIQLNETDIENWTYYYFDYIINVNNLNLDNTKSFIRWEVMPRFFWHRIQNSIGFKVFTCYFHKVDRYIRKYDRNKCLVLFHSDEKYERIVDRIKYIMLQNKISDVYSYKYLKMKINSDALSLEKTVNMHNLVLLVNSVLNKNHNHYCFQVLF